MARILKIDPGFTPCPVSNGDELYPNGIFVFNITKIRAYIQKSSGSIVLEEVAVSDFYKGFSSIDESYVDSVDISLPVLLAEISPNLYSLIDGHHRMEKARRMGVNNVPAYKLSVDQHINFLASKEAYIAYIEYWNGKIRQLQLQ